MECSEGERKGDEEIIFSEMRNRTGRAGRAGSHWGCKTIQNYSYQV